MRRFVLLGVILLIAVGVGFALLPKPEPPEFVSKEHQFRAKFGGEPDVRPTPGEVPRTDYIVESASGLFAVIVREMPLPEETTPELLALFLDSAKDDLIRTERAEQTASSSVTLAGKHPGREFAAKFQQPTPGVLRARIYFVGKRLYQVMVKGTEEFANSKEANAFLESFMVTE